MNNIHKKCLEGTKEEIESIHRKKQQLPLHNNLFYVCDNTRHYEIKTNYVLQNAAAEKNTKLMH